jgi:hypothetical protein
MLSNADIDALTKNGVDFNAELILTLDAMGDRINALTAKVKMLEGQLKELNIWQPGDGSSWKKLDVGDGRDAPS